MKFINTETTPRPILRAFMDNKYQRDLDDHMESIPDSIKREINGRMLSVTTLAKSPRQRLLEKRHYTKVTIEPRDMWWTFLGKIIHEVLEKHAEPGDVIEERVGSVFDIRGVGKAYIHGQADRITGAQSTEHYGPNKLNDWKWTKLRALGYDKSDYHMQVNILAHLLEKSNIRVKPPYYDTYLLKDWDPKFYRGPLGDYPYNPWIVSEADVWTKDEVLRYIQNRAFLHFSAEDLPDDGLPYCTDTELWRSLPIYKIFKLNLDGSKQKKAKARKSTKIEANEWIRNEGAKPDSKGKIGSYDIQMVPQKAMKCTFCVCKPWCNQYQEEQGIESEDDETEE